MKSLIEFIKEIQNKDIHNMLVEMANIQKNVLLGKLNYNIAIHGPSSKDRENPHIHIYLTGDNSLKKFNFEISLVDLICYDELNLIRMLDKTKHKKIDIKNKDKCSWEGYSKLEEDFENWLFSHSHKRGDFIDNLDAIIYYYNEESSDLDSNYLLKYINERNLTIDKKYYKYFSKEDKELYSKCFIKNN